LLWVLKRRKLPPYRILNSILNKILFLFLWFYGDFYVGFCLSFMSDFPVFLFYWIIEINILYSAMFSESSASLLLSKLLVEIVKVSRLSSSLFFLSICSCGSDLNFWIKNKFICARRYWHKLVYYLKEN